MTFNPVRSAGAAAILVTITLPALAPQRGLAQPQPGASKVAQSPKGSAKPQHAERYEGTTHTEHKEEADDRDDD